MALVLLGGAWAAHGSSAPSSRESARRISLLPIESTTRLEDIQQTPDGRLLLTHDRGANPKIWEAKRMKLLGYLSGHREPVGWARLSPDGSKVLTLSRDLAILWDARRIKPLAQRPAPEGEALALASWAGGSQSFALSTEKGKYAIAPAQAGSGALNFHPSGIESPSGLALSPDGGLLIASTQEGGLAALKPEGGRAWSIKALTGPAPWLAWATDGRHFLATGTGGKAVLISKEGAIASTYDHQVGEKGYLQNTQMGALFAGAKEEEVLTFDSQGVLTLHPRQGGQPRTIPGGEAPVREVRVSPDGLKAATYSTDERLRIWDLAQGKELPFTRGEELPTAGEFSSDSAAFWVGASQGAILRHDLASGEIRLVQPGALLPLRGFTYHPQTRRLLLAGKTPELDAFDASEAALALSLDQAGPGAFAEGSRQRALLSPSGRWMIKTAHDGVDKTLLDLNQGGKVAAVKQWSMRGTSWSPSEDRILILQDLAKVVVLDGPTLEPIEVSNFGGEGQISSAALSDEGLIVAAGWKDKEGKSRLIVSAVGQNEFKAFSEVVSDWCKVRFIKGGSQILVVDGSRVAVHDAQTLAPLQVIPRLIDGAEGMSVQVVKDRWVCLTGAGTTVFDLEQGKMVYRSEEASGWGRATTALNDEGSLLVVAQGRKLALVDLATGQESASAETLDGVVEASFLPGTPLVGAVDPAEGLVLFDARKGLERVGRICLMADGTWLVVDEEGRFDASDPNSVKGASFILDWEEGREAIDVSQLKNDFYEPGLFAKLAGLDPSPRRPTPSLDALRLPPQVTLSKGAAGRVEVELAERDQGGLGTVTFKVNGKVVERRPGAGYFTFDLAKTDPFLLPQASLQEGGSNWLSVTCTNQSGTLESPPEDLDLGIPPSLQAPDIRLYALFVGVGDYAGQTGDLQAPPRDAQALAKGVRESAERLLPGRVAVEVLASGGKAPTRAAILQWLSETSAKAKSSDIVLVYLSGHGASQVGSQSGYFFLTSECDPSTLTPASLASSTVSGADLQAGLNKVAASKQVVILDTCHSGAAAQDLVSSRASGSDYRRAYEALRDATGIWLLAGSAADQLSYESTQVDHGMLTYSLLEAIDRATPEGLRAGQGGELFLDVERWLTYAANRVESLKNEVGVKGIQRPELRRSAARSSFDLGVTGEAFRGSLGLRPPKPVVLIGSFDQDEEDPAGLEKEVASAFRSSEVLKPWFDIAKHPGVYRIAGSYTTEGGSLTVRVVVQKLDKEMNRKNLEAFEVKGALASLADLAGQVRAGAERIILKAEQKP